MSGTSAAKHADAEIAIAATSNKPKRRAGETCVKRAIIPLIGYSL